MINLPRALLFLALAVTIGHARVFDQALNIHNFRRSEGWNFLGRMTLSPGTVDLTLQLHISFPQPKSTPSYSLELTAIPSDLWQTQLSHKCNSSSLSLETFQLKKERQINLPVLLLQQGNYHSVSSISKQIGKQQTYNFVLKDCGQTLLKEGFGRRSKVEVKLDVMNNQLHTSAFDTCYNWVLPLIILAQALLALMLQRGNEDDGDNWSKYLLKISLWVGIGSMLFKYLGHAIYAHMNGYHYEIFDVLYLLFLAVSDYIVIYLLIFLAFGWTVTFFKGYDMELYVPMGCMLGFVHIILVVMNKIQDGTHHKYHMFDSVPAYIMLAFRIIALGLFLYGILKSLMHLNHQQSKRRHYFHQLLPLGSLYLAFIPIGFMLINFVEAEQRQQLMFMGLQITKLVLSAWLAYLAGNKHSSYRAVLNSSFMEKEEKYY